MPGDRGLVFVILAAICAIGLWITSARTVAHPAARIRYIPPAAPLPRLSVISPRREPARGIDDESKSRLAEALGLTPLD